MEAYMIENKHGELILWTANHIRQRLIEKFVEFKKQSWIDLEDEGYSVRKVLIQKIVE